MSDFFENAVTKAQELLDAAIAAERRNNAALLTELRGQAAVSKIDYDEKVRLLDIFQQTNAELRGSVVNLEHELEVEKEHHVERQVTDSPTLPENQRTSDRWTGTHTDFHDDNIDQDGGVTE